MKTELEKADIEAIAAEVLERIRPLLKHSATKEDDKIFDVKGLASYLQVAETWVYNQVALNGIPFFKCGKYTRFRKADIDSWIGENTVKVVSLSKANSKINLCR